MVKQKYLRGNICYADLKKNEGSVQSGRRPVLIIQNDVGNMYSPTIIVVPLTKVMKKKEDFPTHKTLLKSTYSFLEENSVVICEQIMTISKSQILNNLGSISDDDMNDVEGKLFVSLALKKNVS